MPDNGVSDFFGHDEADLRVRKVGCIWRIGAAEIHCYPTFTRTHTIEGVRELVGLPHTIGGGKHVRQKAGRGPWRDDAR